MRLMPGSPEVVAQMPEIMFADLETALQLFEQRDNLKVEFTWVSGDGLQDGHQQLFDAVEPLRSAILARETRLIQGIGFAISSGVVLPGRAQRKSDWHRDINGLEKRRIRYATSDILPTEFLRGGSDILPYSLVRFNQQEHRSPANNTGRPIHRTWIRASVIF